MTKEEFDKKDVGKKLAIHCSTEKLAEEFLEMADSFGYNWCSGNCYINDTRWDYGKDTCYCIVDGEYSDLNFYKNYKYEIISFETLPKVSTIKNDVLYDILIGKMAELEEDIETLQGIIDSTREEIVSKNDSLILIEELLEKYDDAEINKCPF